METRTRQYGALPLENGQTLFRLWAPDAHSVHLELREGECLAMDNDQGWFHLAAPAGHGTAYRFRINDDLRVPDPASQAQHNDIHDWSLVVDHSSYPWQCTDWRGRPWHETVIYEIHVGLMGGFAGVIRHLPLMMELGITAIELMPLNEFPGSRNWGYDGALLFAPEASYGTPDELKHLIDCAHELGIMVFIDVVYNHFGPDGNYLGCYASPFFRPDVHTPWGAAIDFRRPEVREFFLENALMWVLDYRVDGLRFDAVHAIDDNAFLVEMANHIRASVPTDRHLHLMLENEHNSASLLTQGFTAQWNDDGHNILHHLLTDEAEGYYADFVEQPTAKLARCLSAGFIFQGEATRSGKRRGEPSAHLSPTAFILFLQNHDQVGNRAFGERLHQLAHPQALEAATLLLLLCPMVPLLFMGEEWAADQPFLYFTDHNETLAEAVYQGRRNEFAAFSPFNQGRQDEIPPPNAEATFEQSRLDFSACLLPEHRERLALYRELIDLRRREIVPRLPGASALGATILADKAISARWRLNDQRELRIDINLGEEEVMIDLPPSDARILYRYRVGDDHWQRRVLPGYSGLATLEHSRDQELGRPASGMAQVNSALHVQTQDQQG